jgi:hypothetical protein
MRLIQVRAIAGVLLAGLVMGCGGPAAPTIRVLFIGNSYTSENDLPRLFADLSRAGGHPVAVDMVAVGGATLAQHLGGADAPARIAAQTWDIVVLQEQSVLPALAGQRATEMYPAVRQLVRLARNAGARPMLLLTWGRRDGLRDAGFSSFVGMQAQLTKGYLGIANELGVAVAPAGEVWRRVVASDAGLKLWQEDGSHPSLVGSYLTACVLYAAIYGESPVGLAAPSEVSREKADLLQQLARDVAIGDAARWHLTK